VIEIKTLNFLKMGTKIINIITIIKLYVNI